MEEDYKKYVTINTHMGLFQYNRPVFGIISAPAIWQRLIDKVWEETSGTSCIFDYIYDHHWEEWWRASC